MKKSSSIAAIAMSIFTAVLIISVISAYQSTYGFSLQSVEDSVVINGSSVGINETVMGNNFGLTAVNLFLMNKSYTVSPGEKVIHDLLLPLNLDKLTQMGYPTHNVSIGVSLLAFLAALFFNLSKTFTLGKSVIPAPFDNFSVAQFSSNRNGTALISVTFNYLLPFIMHVSEILVKTGNITVGNLSLNGLSHGFNRLSSLISLPSGFSNGNLTFSAGPLSWNSTVTVRA